MTLSTNSKSKFIFLSAPLIAIAPNLGAGTVLKDPRNDPDYDMDQHYMDYDLPEGKLKSLAEALGYIIKKND